MGPGYRIAVWYTDENMMIGIEVGYGGVESGRLVQV